MTENEFEFGALGNELCCDLFEKARNVNIISSHSKKNAKNSEECSSISSGSQDLRGIMKCKSHQVSAFQWQRAPGK